MVQTKLLSEQNKYKDGKRIITQTIEQTRDIWDDYSQLAECYFRLSELSKKGAAHDQADPAANVTEEIRSVKNMIDILQNYIKGYEEDE